MNADDLDERRERLKRALDAHEAAQKAEEERHGRQGSMAGFAAAFRMSTEFVSGILVGGVIGYLLDWWLGISPWGMIVFLLLGFAAGVVNVLRSAGLIQTPNVGKRPPDGA